MFKAWLGVRGVVCVGVLAMVYQVYRHNHYCKVIFDCESVVAFIAKSGRKRHTQQKDSAVNGPESVITLP
ncbi:hypothetical protein LOAG_01277 [Loa loa]|uniref:Uncharacterized protein n=1 Tax=Loa loa TaxID=7209 RepID=A0A1S0U9W5_LOALO|nr:hypothetical protein LOAG_01277 [Loa loa]EFO27212.1 hypothetical protein LOAG_01277 [Loa loa]